MEQVLDSTDLVQSIYSFIGLGAHFNLARTSSKMRRMGGVPLPLKMRTSLPWNKDIQLPPGITNVEAVRFLGYANIDGLDCSGCLNLTPDVLHAVSLISPLKTFTIKGLVGVDPSIVDSLNEKGGILQYLPARVTTLDISGLDDLNDNGLISLQVISRNYPLITDLNLSGTEVTGTSLNNLRLCYMPLRRVNLSDCSELRDISSLPEFPDLREVDLSGYTRLTGSDWSPLLEMSRLEVLKVLDTPIEEGEWCYLQGLENLQHLEISDATDESVEHITRLPIQDLSFNGSRVQCTDTGLQKLQTLPLRKLTLTDCDGITGHGLVPLLTTLKELSLVHCDGFIQEELEKLYKRFREKLTVTR
jgi:hypothetical protein